MTLKELVREAMTKNRKFGNRYIYWVIKKKRTPDLEWLMKNLEKVLGKQYVREAAEKFIESQEK